MAKCLDLLAIGMAQWFDLLATGMALWLDLLAWLNGLTYRHGSVVGLVGTAQSFDLQAWLSGVGLVVIASLCVQGVEACWHGSSGVARG
jgi:hypothetical protein